MSDSGSAVLPPNADSVRLEIERLVAEAVHDGTLLNVPSVSQALGVLQSIYGVAFIRDDWKHQVKDFLQEAVDAADTGTAITWVIG